MFFIYEPFDNLATNIPRIGNKEKYIIDDMMIKLSLYSYYSGLV